MLWGILSGGETFPCIVNLTRDGAIILQLGYNVSIFEISYFALSSYLSLEVKHLEASKEKGGKVAPPPHQRKILVLFVDIYNGYFSW